ncbi:uncharacterized protein LOC126785436 [Argentina anserina]|uniref:uncharacterized protein LOC126785436 n=1 Tax=Argentina anserina TaxID=57926 RepID=UPI0021766BE0|nr:uncharacterized protein LOC126785436 [Potentilla anserina]
MGKKKFIDKKKSSTFQLIARDSSDPNYDDSPGGDRVFVQVSGRPTDDSDSIFADAPDDEEGDHYYNHRAFGTSSAAAPQPLPEKLRKEILDLGFPDDGYNYLNHLREIKNTGGGSAYYSNPKAKPEQLPHDVKAYDASKLRISENEAPDEEAIYKVASKTVNVRVQRALDPEVLALLDDSDAASRFGSEDEDLEEDFVVKANLPDGEEEEEEEDVCVGGEPSLVEQSENKNVSNEAGVVSRGKSGSMVDDPRARRDVDDEFDMVLSREYDNDDDDEDDDYEGGDHDDEYFYGDEEDKSIEEKLKNVKLNDCVKDDFELNEYEVPGDNEEIQKTKQLGKIYENEDQEDEVVFVEESSDESEKWDCETVITTYSTLENHPAKIGAPELSRKKKQLSETVFKGLDASNNLIKLGGKQKLPVDFLPGSRRPAATEKVEKMEDVGSLKTEQLKRKQHGQESKEEKKERKAAVKEERREARRAKKELKELYKGEAQHAQRIAAISGPSSKRLM